jgi:hypothetical protein
MLIEEQTHTLKRENGTVKGIHRSMEQMDEPGLTIMRLRIS